MLTVVGPLEQIRRATVHAQVFIGKTPHGRRERVVDEGRGRARNMCNFVSWLLEGISAFDKLVQTKLMNFRICAYTLAYGCMHACTPASSLLSSNESPWFSANSSLSTGRYILYPFDFNGWSISSGENFGSSAFRAALISLHLLQPSPCTHIMKSTLCTPSAGVVGLFNI